MKCVQFPDDLLFVPVPCEANGEDARIAEAVGRSDLRVFTTRLPPAALHFTVSTFASIGEAGSGSVHFAHFRPGQDVLGNPTGHISAETIEHQALKNQIRALTDELEKERERSKGLAGLIAIMEANAGRLASIPKKCIGRF